MKKMAKILTSFLLVCVLLMGCCAFADAAPAGEPKKVANVVAEYNEWNQLFFDQLKLMADEYGWTIETFDAAQDANQQINMVNSAIAQDFDYLMIQPVDSAALNPSLEKAADAGIAVINYYGLGEEDPLADKIYQVGFDQYGSGALEAEEYIKLQGEEAKVALIGGLTGADNARLRSEGMRSVFEQYPGIEIVQEVFCDWDRQKAMAAAEDIITANSDLDAFVVQDDSMSWGVYEAIEAAGKADQIKIASQGFYESSIPAIKEDKFLFTISYPPAYFAKAGMETFKSLADGEEPEKIKNVEMLLVTKENVDTAPY